VLTGSPEAGGKLRRIDPARRLELDQLALERERSVSAASERRSGPARLGPGRDAGAPTAPPEVALHNDVLRRGAVDLDEAMRRQRCERWLRFARGEIGLEHERPADEQLPPGDKEEEGVVHGGTQPAGSVRVLGAERLVELSLLSSLVKSARPSCPAKAAAIVVLPLRGGPWKRIRRGRSRSVTFGR
jgi:hypothetical protein